MVCVVCECVNVLGRVTSSLVIRSLGWRGLGMRLGEKWRKKFYFLDPVAVCNWWDLNLPSFD